MTLPSDKGLRLLDFLRATASIRRKRIASYGSADKILWFGDIPRERGECRSPFLTSSPDEVGGLWLEVRKKRMPARPPEPRVVTDWVRTGDLDQPDHEPDLLTQITVIVERQMPDPEAPADTRSAIVEETAELRRLANHPEVEEAWLDYLINKWEPWAKEMRWWQEVQEVYENLDFMRRRLEEAEERYELVLAIGFLQWRDPTGTAIARHVLTAPAELTLEAARGLLTVVPAASFERFRIELDMLELQHRPRLNEERLAGQIAALDVQAWDTALVAPLLHEIANSLHADAQVDETFQCADHVDERPRLSFAPAVVLRERQPTAYDELVGKLLETASGDGLGSTPPWDRFLLEGEPSQSRAGDPVAILWDEAPATVEPDRLLFPLPTNDEQRLIARRLEEDLCVLVKGPPGTGKSHTIANLICHLLARGERLLVTAQAPKALAVLRGLLPDDIRDLCVTALGSSREDQRLLEETVRGLLRRKHEWRGHEAARRAIEKLEGDLRELEGELARVERDLREFREAATHFHELPGGYSGTAAQIARALSEQEQEFGWFPELSAGAGFPLDPSETALLAEAHAHFTGSLRLELELEIGDGERPSPNEFEALVARLTTAREAAQRAGRGADEAKAAFLASLGMEQIRGLRDALQEFSRIALRAERSFGQVSRGMLEDLVAGAKAKWARRANDSEALLREVTPRLRALGSVRVKLPDGIPEDQLSRDVRRRLEHFVRGGSKGFLFFAPRVVRETGYLVKRCQVDRKHVTQVKQLERLHDFLEMRRNIRELHGIWGGLLKEALSSRQAASSAQEFTDELKALLVFFESKQAGVLAAVLGMHRTALVSEDDRTHWLNAIDATIASSEARHAEQELDRIHEALATIEPGSKAHPCVGSMLDALRRCDVVAWRRAWEERERVRQEKRRLREFEGLLLKLDEVCPGLAELLRENGGEPSWRERVRRLREAWNWAAARSWVQRVSNATAYEARVEDYHRLQKRIEHATKLLASHRAWNAFFERFDEKTFQSLNAWTRAVDRIGKGTGKHAYRHRRTARRYLMDCVPRIPAWIMPLHKLWDSVEAVPGLFDTVIVDEASQAGVDALVLLLLAKRIIVVGDEKQNSPEAVGVPEDDIARLAREHLSAFRFRDEFRPDASLFDHAERTFVSHITLREHFRCVPEIIRFSNELCYRDAPLIPLRQAPPERLPALRSSFVAEGACEGDGQRIQNRAEAKAVVETIVRLVDEEAYEGKTMGVIGLQGHAQAQLIETLLAKRLDPGVMENRRLRCGEPASFQGDERDVIFLSLVIAPNVNYRALTRLSDQRRFNVAMSRARDQVWLFHSVKPHDLGPDDLRRRLVSFFERPQALDVVFEDLDRLEREAKKPPRRGTPPDPYESWFEVDVALELLRRKFRVRPQVEVAGRWIDLVVEGVDARLAVECDGDEWHGAEQYDRDMQRQRQLERAGWTFVRVRESEFYVDRRRALAAVLEACEELRIRPLGFVEEPRREAPGAGASDDGDEPVPLAGNTADSEDLEFDVEECDVSSSLVGPFTGYSDASRFPDPREGSLSSLQEHLRAIIMRDGPLPRSSVYRLYVEGCPSLQRVGRVVRQALNRALGGMLRAGEIVQEDELKDGLPEGQILRLAGAPPVNLRPAGKRDLFEIPPSELLLVLRKSFPEINHVDHDDEVLSRALLEYYGFRRLTKPRREYLSKVLRIFRQSDRGLGINMPAIETIED